MASDVAEKARKHMAHSRQYFENGQEALRREEVSKAGELFWGGMTQAFHALAAIRGIDVTSHRRLKNFAIDIADELNDQTLLANFMAVEILHRGFYDIDVELTDVERGAEFALKAVDVVRGLIPDEADSNEAP